MKYNLIIALCLMTGLAGCQHETDMWQDKASANSLCFTASRQGEEVKEEDKIHEVTAYRFVDRSLAEVLHTTPDSEGNCTLPLKERQGEVYFVANAMNEPVFENIVPGESLDHFLSLSTTAEIAPEKGLLMTHSYGAEELYAGKRISMVRSVARVDLSVKVAGVQVKRVALFNVAQSGFVFPQLTDALPPEVTYGNVEKNYPEMWGNRTETVAYLNEQKCSQIRVVIYALIRGGETVVEAMLPTKIERNKIYTVRLRSIGAKLEAEVLSADWETGDSSETIPEKREVIDLEASELGDSIKLSASGDTLFIPYTQNSFEVKLIKSPEEQVNIVGNPYQASVRLKENSQEVLQVQNKLRYPGVWKDYVDVEIVNAENVLQKKAVMVFMNNPIVLENNRLTFDEHGVADFGTYAEGEFATFVLPEGKIATISFEEGEDHWAKMTEVEGRSGVYRLVGGWKPNDPKADGREQWVTIDVSNQDGTQKETLVVKRRNIALPVVQLYGVWWCKYNAIANSKRIEEQITYDKDPARIKNMTVAEYLKTCSAEEYRKLWGWNYIGSSGEGMKVIERDGKLVYEGYTTNPDQNLIDVAPKALAPEGYEIPAMEDWNQIVKAGMKMNITGFYTFSDGKKRHGTHYERTDIVSTNGKVYHLHIQDNNHKEIEGVTLYGPGSQWNNNGINLEKIFLASYKSGWFHDGSFRVYAGNKNDSRIVRFKKSAVEYVYE